MHNASLKAFLYLAGFRLTLDASYYDWQQAIDHRGRPRGKPRAGRWSFRVSNLSQAEYEYLLTLIAQRHGHRRRPRRVPPHRRPGRVRHRLGPALLRVPRLRLL